MHYCSGSTYDTDPGIHGMSVSRVSLRVQFQEKRLQERLEREEQEALAACNSALDTFWTGVNTAVTAKGDFELPQDLVDSCCPKKCNAKGSSSDDVTSAERRERVPKREKLDYPPYRTLRQNLYRPPLQRVILPAEECPTCDCTPATGCNDRCHNRLVFMECLPGLCPTLATASVCQEVGSSRRNKSTTIKTEDDHSVTSSDNADEQDIEDEGDEDFANCCANTAIQTKRFPQVEVFLTTSIPPPTAATEVPPAAIGKKRSRDATPKAVHKGYGLKVSEAVRRGTIIAEYLGEVITAEEGLRRMKGCTPDDAFYFAGLDNGLLLDAKAMGSVARFANHSCAPTCELQKWTVQGECRLVLAALRDLQAGEEVTYNYHYFDDALEGLRGMRRQVCLCGSANCCGTIGGRVTAIADQSDTAVGTDPVLVYEECVAMGIIAPADECNRATASAGSTDIKSEQASVARTESESARAGVTHASAVGRRYTTDVWRELHVRIEKALKLCKDRADVPSTRFYTNRSAELAPQLAQCQTAIQAILDEADGWLQSYQEIFPATGTRVAQNVAQQLLNRAPLRVKMPEVSQLEGWMKAAVKADKALDHLFSKRNNSAVESLLESGSSSSARAACSANKAPQSSATWDDLLSAAKCVITALPLLCSPTKVRDLLLLYDHVALWTRRLVTPIIPGASRGGKQRVSGGHTAAAAVGGALGATEELPILQQLLETYFQQPLSPGLEFKIDDAPASVSAQVSAELVVKTEPLDVQSSSSTAAPAVTITLPPKTTSTAVKRKSTTAPKATIPVAALTVPLLADPFTAAGFLDDRLTIYMEKMQMEDALERKTQSLTQVPCVSVASELSAATATSNLVCTKAGGHTEDNNTLQLFRPAQAGIRTVEECWQFIASETAQDTAMVSTASSPVPHSSSCSRAIDRKLYCFCRLSEEDGECAVLSQCTTCLNWYHPQCVNSPATSLTAASRMSDLQCPVCQFLHNEVSLFAYAPQSEWAQVRLLPAPTVAPPAVVKKGRPLSHVAAPSAKKKGKPAKGSRVTKVGAIVEPVSLQGDGTVAGDDVAAEDPARENKRQRSNAPTPGAPKSMTVPVLSGGLKSRAAPTVKAKDYVTLTELEDALLQEAQAAVTASPVALLLRLAHGYVMTWKQDCLQWLSSTHVTQALALVSVHLTCATRGELDKATIRPNDLVLQAHVLQRTLELYFQTKIIRIRCEGVCAQLRQLIWLLTLSPVLRSVSCATVAPDSAPAAPVADVSREEGGRSRQVLCVEELERIVRGGEALFSVRSQESILIGAHAVSVGTVAESVLCWLRGQLTSANAALEAARACTTVEAAAAVQKQLASVTAVGVVEVRGEYVYAKVQCLLRPRTKDPPLAADLEKPDCGDDGGQTRVAGSTADTKSKPSAEDAQQNAGTLLATTAISREMAVDDAADTGSGCGAGGTGDALCTVYCWCRQGDDGTPMVACDTCEEWFHCDCVGLTSAHLPGSSANSGNSSKTKSKMQGKGKKRPDSTSASSLSVADETSYLCISCCVLSGQDYPYAW